MQCKAYLDRLFVKYFATIKSTIMVRFINRGNRLWRVSSPSQWIDFLRDQQGPLALRRPPQRHQEHLWHQWLSRPRSLSSRPSSQQVHLQHPRMATHDSPSRPNSLSNNSSSQHSKLPPLQQLQCLPNSHRWYHTQPCSCQHNRSNLSRSAWLPQLPPAQLKLCLPFQLSRPTWCQRRWHRRRTLSRQRAQDRMSKFRLLIITAQLQSFM